MKDWLRLRIKEIINSGWWKAAGDWARGRERVPPAGHELNNIAASLRFHGVEGGEAAPLVAAAVLLVAGVIAAAALRSSHGNPAYALVFLWALSAVYAAGGQQSGAVAAGAGIAGLLVIGATTWGLAHGGAKHWVGSADPHPS